MKTITLSANTSWYLYNFRASTIRRFIEHGYRVVCLSPLDDYSPRLEDELKAEWRLVPIDNMGSNPVRDMRLIANFWRHYRELKPVAAFHFTIKNNIYGTWAARLNDVPAVNNVSGLGTAFIRKGPVGVIVRFLYRLSMPLAHLVFCQNEEDFKFLVENKLVPSDRLEQLPGSGVNLQRFHPGLSISHGGPFRFLYAGRMLGDKGLREVVEAVQRVNIHHAPCELWLCGFSDTKNISAILPSELDAWSELDCVEYLGPTDRIETIYAQVDCVVLPSYREGMPRSLLEAGAMGLPVIATNVPGCRNIVVDGFNGILVEPKSSDALVSAMTAMIDMPGPERTTMGERGRAVVVEGFSEDLVVDRAMAAVKALETDS